MQKNRDPKMNTINIVITIISLSIGIIIGEIFPVDIDLLEKQIGELEEMTELLESSNSVNDLNLVSDFNSYIQVLENVEQKNLLKIANLVIENLGRTYYNYTYEDERYMNSDSFNECLTLIEEKAVNSELFKKVIEYKPN